MMRTPVLGLTLALLAAAWGCERSTAPTALEPGGAASLSKGGSDDRNEHADEVAEDAVARFDRLVGNPRPYVGNANPIRGLGAGGLPWTLRSGSARLASNGELRVEVRGLTLDGRDSTVAARGLGGQNPLTSFRATLSCQTVGTGGMAAVVNVQTAPVPASTTGDAQIRERLTGIPSPCIAPIVFVTTPTGAWIAASGF